jgi:hypothetical protein
MQVNRQLTAVLDDLTQANSKWEAAATKLGSVEAA